MLWDFVCKREHIHEHWVPNSMRNATIPCPQCGQDSTRCPGGKGMLYFEEGRQRTHWSMSNKPISSYKQQRQMMKEHGLVEAGASGPERLKHSKRGPIKPEMKEYMAAQKGRWI